MTWEISMSAEGWQDFERGLFEQTFDWLREACATCVADGKEANAKELNGEHWDDDDWEDIEVDWEKEYNEAYNERVNLPHDRLVDEAMRWAKDNNSCSNGGWDIYVDAGGYFKITLEDYRENNPSEV